MSKETTKRRIDKLNVRKTAQAREKPADGIQETLEIFNQLAADGFISADTLSAIHAIKDKKDFDLYECCTTEELRRLVTLCEQE